MESSNLETYPKVEIEYCRVCDYSGHCQDLAEVIKSYCPHAPVICKQGRQGAFEVLINNKLVYSKLQTMALPEYEEVAKVVKEVSLGEMPRTINGQQPINCAIS